MKKLFLILALIGCVLAAPTSLDAQRTQITVTTLLNAQSAATTTGTIPGPINGNKITIYVAASAGVSAGVVTIEEAATSSYTGTWSVVQAVTTSAASTVTAVHLDGFYGALRVRISTEITGGTVTVTSLHGD